MSARPSDPAIDRALSELGALSAPHERPSIAARRRDRIVGALGAVLGSVRIRRRLVRRAWHGLFLVAALTAVVLATGAILRTASPDALAGDSLGPLTTRAIQGEVVVRELGERPFIAEGGEALGGGETLETESGSSLELALASGRVRVGGEARLEVRRPNVAERRLKLTAGAVDVDLPVKLPNGQALVLETPDVEVRVIGTAFSVDVVRSGEAPGTRVKVRRGTVWILKNGKRTAVLAAGQSWASELPAAARAESPAPPRAEPTVSSEPEIDARRAPAGKAVKVASGTLAEENRLFEAALAARNAGDNRRAADIFGSLMAKYPRSVLAEQALAERFRAQHRSGQTSAAIAGARRYLSSYSRGFARADAERIAGSASP